MKIRIQRIGRSEHYTPHYIDNKLMEGTIRGGLHIGKELLVSFARISEGEWCTTKVTSIEYKGEKLFLVHTKNSIYLVVKGWKGE